MSLLNVCYRGDMSQLNVFQRRHVTVKCVLRGDMSQLNVLQRRHVTVKCVTEETCHG